MAEYLMSGQMSETERLTVQSRVWEPAGDQLLQQLDAPPQPRALDVGCGPLGWLRLLSRWAGPAGAVIGTDFQDSMLDAAHDLIRTERLTNVTVVKDDLFNSGLEPGSFDLVHARFEIAPLGRAAEQLSAYLRLAKPGAWLILEDPDQASWRFNPHAPACDRLIELIVAAFTAAGGDFAAGRGLRHLLSVAGIEAQMAAHVVALAPGHPYLRVPLQFAVSLRERLLSLVAEAELDQLVTEAEDELAHPDRWGTSFMVIQAWGRVP